jgi:hypothetical protein
MLTDTHVTYVYVPASGLERQNIEKHHIARVKNGIQTKVHVAYTE